MTALPPYTPAPPAERETIVFIGRGRDGASLFRKSNVAPETDAKKLGVASVIHLAQDGLQKWLNATVEASDKNKPMFILTETMAPALHILRTTHIPVAVIGRAPHPTSPHELAVWRMQSLAWGLMKVLCIANCVPFFAVGDPSKGFRIIAKAMRRLQPCVAQSLFVYMLPLALTVLPVQERRSLFGLLRASLLSWGWHIPLADKHRNTATASCIAKTFIATATAASDGGEDAALVPVGLWCALQTSGKSAEDVAITSVWVHAAAMLADEAWGVMREAEESMGLPVAFVDPKALVPGWNHPSWGMVAWYAIDKSLLAPKVDGSPRDYEFNTVTSAMGAQLLVALGLLETMHAKDFDATSNTTECCWTMHVDTANAMARHMQREWLLSCLPGSKVVAAAKKKGVPPPPGLQDARLAMGDGVIRALAKGESLAKALTLWREKAMEEEEEEEEGGGKRKRRVTTTVGEDGEEGEDLDGGSGEEMDVDSDDSDDSYSVGSVGDGSSMGDWSSGEEESDADDEGEEEEEEEVVVPVAKKAKGKDAMVSAANTIVSHFKPKNGVSDAKLGAAIINGGVVEEVEEKKSVAVATAPKSEKEVTFADVFGEEEEEVE